MIDVDLDEVVEKAVEDHCQKEGHSDEITALMLRIVRRFRSGDVEDGDLGNFMQQLLALMDGD